MNTRTLLDTSSLLVFAALCGGGCSGSLDPVAAEATETSAQALGPWTDTTESFVYGGSTRTYLLHVPNVHPQLSPIVFDLHGFASSAAEQASRSSVDAWANRHGVITVHPEGYARTGRPQSWNAGGNCCGDAVTDAVDDVGFLVAVLDRVNAVHTIDPKRVFVMGFSNGAFMADRLACERSDRFVAYAGVSGTRSASSCAHDQPVSVMHVHGCRDAVVGVDGSIVFEDFGPISTLRAVVADWTSADGLTARVPPLACGTIGNVTFDAGGTSYDVRATLLGGLGHQWPTAADGYEATTEIGAFFLAHPRP